ncbi:hypothetical protein CEXT_627131 [Caerostris extrusa]|uniref:Uncharacterized protein n=1 Tax=Caerostris extrusa TaxID=172846 RepID=A0AAV4X2M6_CAEEX|nr:hypothetical protein CEXT_627131 [Caerostris extrusa]
MENSLIEQKMKFILLLRKAIGVSCDREGKKLSTENSLEEKAGLELGRCISGVPSMCGYPRITSNRMTRKKAKGVSRDSGGKKLSMKNSWREKAGLGSGRRISGIPSICGDSRITSNRMTRKNGFLKAEGVSRDRGENKLSMENSLEGKSWSWTYLRDFGFEMGLNFLKISQMDSTQIGFI